MWRFDRFVVFRSALFAIVLIRDILFLLQSHAFTMLPYFTLITLHHETFVVFLFVVVVVVVVAVAVTKPVGQF
jgi:hypothetical protein